MKQFRLSSLVLPILIVLIGYFEPANASVISKSITKKMYSDGDAYVLLNNSNGTCLFFPNPISPNQGVTAICSKSDFITNASLVPVGGQTTDAIANNIQIELITNNNNNQTADAIANNIQIELITNDNNNQNADAIANNIQIELITDPITAKLSFATPLPAGEYVLNMTTQSGKAYTTKLVVSQQ